MRRPRGSAPRGRTGGRPSREGLLHRAHHLVGLAHVVRADGGDLGVGGLVTASSAYCASCGVAICAPLIGLRGPSRPLASQIDRAKRPRPPARGGRLLRRPRLLALAGLGLLLPAADGLIDGGAEIAAGGVDGGARLVWLLAWGSLSLAAAGRGRPRDPPDRRRRSSSSWNAPIVGQAGRLPPARTRNGAGRPHRVGRAGGLDCPAPTRREHEPEENRW